MKLLAYLAIAALALTQHTAVAQDPTNPSNAPNLGYYELLRLQKSFWTLFSYPNNVKEAESINSTIFAENVQGRVSDTRNFAGRELNTEYIFGLFIPSKSVSIIGQPGMGEIIQFTANQNIAAASTRVPFTFPQFGNKTLPVVIDTWIAWNDKGEIIQYDATFKWFAHLVQTLIFSLDSDHVAAGGKAVNAIVHSICTAHTQHCVGGNQQYADEAECADFLKNRIRVGQPFEMGMDTLMCRSLHEHMIKFRPDVHCSHIGKTGGGMCDDHTSYSERVEENYFTNTPWIPTVI
ncbi:hypothetical protein B0J11DRAFT_586837 [Dendryphion nanum]|uniref:Uncharacterized protein n=1 Tax=Dendryphion nanum TaxID=256645 RepID=A0A9P9I6A9_9PLEO|nr:hypothetical protein B0J11DRAFT_586837 [Dendryphion nanum]